MANPNRAAIPCRMIIDLLPSYIDGLTSEETNAIIIEHLQACPECKAAYEAMIQPDLEIALTKQTPDNEEKVRYLKKIKSRHRKTILSVVAGLLVVFFAAYYFSSIRIYSFPVDKMEIAERYQFEDGTIYVKVLLNNDLPALGRFSFATQVTDNQLEYLLGYTLIARITQKDRPDNGYLHFVFYPDFHSGDETDIEAVYCSGWSGGSRLLLWQEGDDLPVPTGEEAERLMDEIAPYLGIGYGNSY